MDEVGILEARNNFSTLIERVEKGEEVTITRHGKPVARIIAVDGDRADRARKAAERIRRRRESLPKDMLDGLSIKDLIQEGRM
ncbi:MAG TPA: type II toxin-antitoxin system prevent-host-death family antitoxin [Rhizobiaceae bacterium]|nr:type II toxin-antitoxin system prevent-host-death family antitoxin [Rhizobiaceae bacterium]